MDPGVSGLIWGGSGVDLERIWVDLGWILGGFGWILCGSWVDWGWILGGFEVDLSDVEKYLKMCRPRILIESARFPPFGFDITETNSNSCGNQDLAKIYRNSVSSLARSNVRSD